MTALLQQEHFLCGGRVQTEPHGPQSNLGHRHPAGNQTRHPAAAEASPATCTSTWCSPAKYRRGVFDAEMLNRCEQVMAQVRADFGATLAEFNGEVDHVHLLAAYPPKVALSHLVNSLKGVSSRRLRQDFVGRINRAAMRGRFWSPSYFAGSCGGPPLSTVKDYITNQKRPD
jgi:putative transposase